jgi:hypothetical protein
MGLYIPNHARCLVPGCGNRPFFILSIRMRRHDSGATWAPNLPAYFCGQHANGGSDITILYTPTTTGKNHVKVTVATAPVERMTPIR